MVKWVINLCFCLLLPLMCKATSLILAQKGNRVFIYDVDLVAEIELLEEFAPGVLKMYTVSGQIIHCFYVRNESEIRSKSYVLNHKLSPKAKNRNVSTTKIQRYEVNSGTLLVSGYTMAFCRNGVEVWQDCQVVEKKLRCDIENHETIKWIPVRPIFSFDENYFIFESGKHGLLNNYNVIYEVELETGRKKVIVKGWNPSYDFSGNYILYSSELVGKRWLVYSKIDKKSLRVKFDKAFWLEE